MLPWVFVFFSLLTPSELLSLPLIQMFLQQKPINHLAIFHCVQENRDRSLFWIPGELYRTFNISLSFVDIGKPHDDEELRYAMFARYRIMGIVMDFECSHTSTLLGQFSKLQFFNSSYNWLMFGGRNLDDAVCLLYDENINIDSSIVLAVEIAEEAYDLYDVYGTMKKRQGKVKFAYMGVCNGTTGWPKIVKRKFDFERIELWAVITTQRLHNPLTLYEHLESLEKPKRYTCHRHGYQIGKLLAFKLNFRLKLILANSWFFNVTGLNSSKGVVGQIQTKNVDFSLSPLAVQTERFEIFDQSVEAAGGKYLTIFRHPKNAANRDVFLQPFNNILWCAVIGTLLGACAILIGSMTTESPQHRDSLDTLLLLVLGILCQQGYSTANGCYSSRITIMVVFCFAILLLQFYASFIIGYQLLIPPKTIHTLDQITYSPMSMSVETMPYNYDYFNRTKDPMALRLLHKKIQPNKHGFVNVSVGMSFVKKGGYAFHCDTSYAYTYIFETFTPKQICEMHEIILFPLRPLHIPLVKGVPLKEPFRQTLMKIKETGIERYHRQRYYTKKPKCEQNSNATEQIQLKDIASALGLLIAGMILGLVCLAIEHFKFKLQQHMKRRLVGPTRSDKSD